MLITLSNGVKAKLGLHESVITMTFENSSTVLSCFINGNLEDFLLAHISVNDRDMVRDKILELIINKEKNLNWLNNGSKITALQYAELYLNIQGVDNCKKIIERATAKGLHKNVFFPDGNITKRINIVFLKKALVKFGV